MLAQNGVDGMLTCAIPATAASGEARSDDVPQAVRKCAQGGHVKGTGRAQRPARHGQLPVHNLIHGFILAAAHLVWTARRRQACRYPTTNRQYVQREFTLGRLLGRAGSAGRKMDFRPRGALGNDGVAAAALTVQFPRRCSKAAASNDYYLDNATFRSLRHATTWAMSRCSPPGADRIPAVLRESV